MKLLKATVFVGGMGLLLLGSTVAFAAVDKLPDSYAGFQGKVGITQAESTPWWSEKKRAPENAPNVIVVLVDDMGFSDVGSYGSEIKTPNIDRLAESGVRFNNYTTHPLCSPTRAALLTGRNAHAVGVGWLANNDPGYPGYGGEIDLNTPTIAEILGANGYTTMMVGKWHNTLDFNAAKAGDNSSWPPQRGFNYAYYFMEGETSYFAPSRLQNGNDLVDIDEYPKDYYATDDWTDKSIQWISEHVQSQPDKPFFLYLALNAPHGPLHAKKKDMAKYDGVYEKGWGQIREERYQRQLVLGVIPADTKLPPYNPKVKPWDKLDENNKRLYVEIQKAYAGMIDNVDQNLGRLQETLTKLGITDNTIIIFTSDNGGASGGGPTGSVFSRKFALLPPDPVWNQRALEQGWIGGPRTAPISPWGWAQASNTPFIYYKGYPTNGGVRVPLIVSWPDRFNSEGMVRSQFSHVTDIAPTILDAIGIDYPNTFNGVKTVGPDGKSLLSVLDDEGADAVRTSQYYEIYGNRAYVKDGWKVVSLQKKRAPFKLDNWMLFNLNEDYSESNNLAAQYPEKVKVLAAEFDKVAWENKVYPLDNRLYARFSQYPEYARLDPEPHTFYQGTQTTHRTAISPLISDRSFKLEANFNYEEGEQGVIYALGDTQLGFVLYVENGLLHFAYNVSGQITELTGVAIKTGAQVALLDYTAAGKRQGFGRLLLNGEEIVAKTSLSPTLALGPYEGLDVGIDRRSPVFWELSEKYGTFPYAGQITSVTVIPGAKAPKSMFNLAN